MTASLDAAAIRSKTIELLGKPDIDVSLITEESVAADSARAEATPFADDSLALKTVWYGNNARYGARVVNGVTYQGYWFENDGQASGPGACSTAYTGFVTVNWHHAYLGKCPSGRERWSFTLG